MRLHSFLESLVILLNSPFFSKNKSFALPLLNGKNIIQCYQFFKYEFFWCYMNIQVVLLLFQRFPIGFYISIWNFHEPVVLFCSFRHQCASHVLDFAELFSYELLDIRISVALHCPLVERCKRNKQFRNWTNKIAVLCPCEGLSERRQDKMIHTSKTQNRKVSPVFCHIVVPCTCDIYCMSLGLFGLFPYSVQRFKGRGYCHNHICKPLRGKLLFVVLGYTN